MANEEKRIAKLAKKLVKLEKSLDYSSIEERSDIEAAMEEFILTLTPEDMVQVDDYIAAHHLLN